MALTFLSPEWVVELEKQINASPEYRASSLTWEAGAIALVMDEKPDWLTEDVAIWLDLHHGECRAAKLVPTAEAEEAPFMIEGSYERWKQVLRREIGPVKAMLQGKLKVRGNMVTIMRYVRGAQELVECAARIPTVFPDE